MGNAGAYSFLKALIEQQAPRPGKSIDVKFINTKLGDLDSVEVRRTTAGTRDAIKVPCCSKYHSKV